jgi:chorismate mutase
MARGKPREGAVKRPNQSKKIKCSQREKHNNNKLKKCKKERQSAQEEATKTIKTIINRKKHHRQ